MGNFNVILMFGLILVLGYVAGRVANFFKLPKITGYIIVGILMEPGFLGLIPANFVRESNVLSNFALCVITYAIGGSLYYKKIKSLGKSILTMTLLEAELAFLLVSLGIYFLLPALSKLTNIPIKPEYYLPFAFMAGALASPTDPTADLAIRDEYKAEGPVTTTILGISALDDATGIINFSIATAVSVAVFAGKASNLAGNILMPVVTIFLSILTGVIFGFLLLFTSRKVKEPGVLIVLILGFLFASFGTAQFFKLNELMATMVVGCVVVNFAKDPNEFFISIRDYLEEMIFVVFFVIAGAHLELKVLLSALLLVIVFIILRTIGKFAGAYTGAIISKAPAPVRKYTALGLIPQGGIVVGLALLLRQNPQYDAISLFLLNLILGTTVIHEFAGPILAEIALKKAGEMGQPG